MLVRRWQRTQLSFIREPLKLPQHCRPQSHPSSSAIRPNPEKIRVFQVETSFLIPTSSNWCISTSIKAYEKITTTISFWEHSKHPKQKQHIVFFTACVRRIFVRPRWSVASTPGPPHWSLHDKTASTRWSAWRFFVEGAWPNVTQQHHHPGPRGSSHEKRLKWKSQRHCNMLGRQAILDHVWYNQVELAVLPRCVVVQQPLHRSCAPQFWRDFSNLAQEGPSVSQDAANFWAAFKNKKI